MQFKATMKYHFIPIRMAEIESLVIPTVGKNVEQLGSQFVAVMESV